MVEETRFLTEPRESWRGLCGGHGGIRPVRAMAPEEVAPPCAWDRRAQVTESLWVSPAGPKTEAGRTESRMGSAIRDQTEQETYWNLSIEWEGASQSAEPAFAAETLSDCSAWDRLLS